MATTYVSTVTATPAHGWVSCEMDNGILYSRSYRASHVAFTKRDVYPLPLDMRVHTSQHSNLALLAPDGYSVQGEIPIRLQEEEDGTYLVTTDLLPMYGHSDNPNDAFNDFRESLRDYFLSLLRDEAILGVLPQRDLGTLRSIFPERTHKLCPRSS